MNKKSFWTLKGREMSEYTKHLTPRPELRERIIETAVEAFSAHGIKSITMDDIATSYDRPGRT